MDCEKCQSLLSDFLDGTLIESDRAQLSAHLNECFECFSAHQDLTLIVTAAREFQDVSFTPPNAQAMWIRISNAIEAESRAVKQTPAMPSAARASFLSGFLNRRWELSLGQMAAVVSSVVLIAAFSTVAGLRGLRVESRNRTAKNNETARANPTPVTDRFVNQRMAIEYWQQRVAERRGRWSPQMRETFDRNISVIDQAVNDSMRDLNENPHDEVTEEMLNDAMRGKIELLKEFAEL
jgi:hypothetical protein